MAGIRELILQGIGWGTVGLTVCGGASVWGDTRATPMPADRGSQAVSAPSAADPQDVMPPASPEEPADRLRAAPDQQPAQLPPPRAAPAADARPEPLPAPATPSPTTLPIDLAYALTLVNAANPTIALARERVQEANARRQEAAVLWIPNAWIGGNPQSPTFVPTFYHHDGNVQNAMGRVFDTVKTNFFLGAGLTLDYSLADALFLPRIARQVQNAVVARARAVEFDVQLQVASAYLDLLRVYGALAVNAEALTNAEQMLAYAEQAERNGLGKTTADANRARAEVAALREERINLEGDTGVASARLAQLLLLDPVVDLIPADRTVVPIALVPISGPLDEFIAVALLNRPELAESRALIQAALIEWRGNKVRPLIPTLQVFFYEGSFQGGTPVLGNTGRRDDIVAQASWELRNGGLGDWFRVKESRSRYNQANLHLLEIQAQVGAEVAAAAKQVLAGERALRSAQESVRESEEMWTRLSRAAFGFAGPARQYDPLEALLAEQQLYRNRLRYLDETIAFNRNQFRLYWAMGKPPRCALPEAQPVPVQVPVLPQGDARR
jgi:outer membrane protein TolC